MKKKVYAIIFITSLFICNSALAQTVASHCYRGFLDAGYTFGVGDYKELGRIEVNTSHGYQFNPYIFAGGGMGLHFMQSYETPDMEIPLDKRDSKVDIPVFANVRGTFMTTRFAPFLDVKGGCYVNNNGGLYLNVSAGLRIAVNHKQAVNIAVGYTNEKLEFETFDRFTKEFSLEYTRIPTKYNAEGITLKLGYEF